MTTPTLAKAAVTLAGASVVFTLCVWAWILSRPAGTFHDQGGLAITIIYFPVTFMVWLFCALPSAALRRRKLEALPDHA
jgi:hypothetical protein